MKFSFLKFVYNGILSGMPIVTYNPITQNTLNVPLTVLPYSTYINFKLSDAQSQYLSDYIGDYTNDLELVSIPMTPQDTPSNYLSVNVYNCTSPVFMNEAQVVTRCEINTYVRDKRNGALGTLIIDYLSNGLSMDPLNIFKWPEHTLFANAGSRNEVECVSKKEEIYLSLNITKLLDYKRIISDELIKYTDNVYYKNGIMDKIYYDSSLVHATTKSPCVDLDVKFRYKDLCFTRASSIFYFTNNIRFIGGMWENRQSTSNDNDNDNDNDINNEK